MALKESIIQLTLKAKDLLSGNVEKSSESLEKMSAAAEKLKQQQKQLENQQKTIVAFEKQAEAVDKAEQAYSEAASNMQKLAEESRQAAAPAERVAASLDKSRTAAEKSRTAFEKNASEVEALKRAYDAAENPSKELTAELERAEKVLSQSRKTYREHAGDVAALQREYKAAEAPAKKLAAEFTKAEKSTARLEKTYKGQAEQLGRLENELRGAEVNTAEFASEQNRLQSELDQTADALKEVTTKQKQARAELSKTNTSKAAAQTRSYTGAVRENAVAIGKWVAGLYLVNKAIDVVGSGVRGLGSLLTQTLTVGDEFDKLADQMEAVMGSVAGGEEAVQWVEEFTKSTPLQLQQTTEAFTTLKNFGIDPMNGSMQAIVDQSEKLGGGIERLDGIVLALGQAWSKQKLQMEEINQLVERGVPAWDLLEKATGKNAAALADMSSNGELGRDAIAALIQEMGQAAEGEAAKGMTRLSGIVSNLKDQFDQFLNRVADAGALDYFKSQLSELGERITEMANDGRLQAIAQSTSDFFIRTAESIKQLVGDISFDELVAKVQASVTTLTENTAGFFRTVEVTAAGIRLITNAVSAGISTMAAAYTGFLSASAKATAGLLDLFGADEWSKRAEQVSNALAQFAKDRLKGVEQDSKDMQDALRAFYKKSEDAGKGSLKKQTENVSKGLSSQQQLWQAHVDGIVNKQKGLETASKETAIAVNEEFENLAETISSLDTVETVHEVNKLKRALVKAFDDGKISNKELKEGLEATTERMKELRDSAGDTGSELDQVGKKGADVGNQVAAGAANANSVAGALAGSFNAATNSLREMSPAAESLFKKLQGAEDISFDTPVSGAEALKAKLEGVNSKLSELANAEIHAGADRISQSFIGIGKNSAYAEKQVLQQKIKLAELVEGYQDGSISAASFASRARAATNQMEFLNDQDLAALNAGIAQAEAQMQQLEDSTRSTVNGLQNELDRLRGNTADIEERQYKERERELADALKQAQASGDAEAISNAKQSLQLNRQIYKEKTSQLKAEEAARKKKAADEKIEADRKAKERQQEEATQRKQAAQTTSSRTGTEQVKTVRHVVDIPGQVGRNIDVLEGSSGNFQNMLSELAQARRNTGG
ncbi:tape measure protein [Parendozoicomonas sp. Alg238-R29]|uniref:tape measure protein n=1 Tax=Parendozoicomonas sp. Alg238-R29 TaxID=2993446 RepID=UPI00248D9672|nr:tape measure protein [Parendozoicomonas sp. Alg238-R29]